MAYKRVSNKWLPGRWRRPPYQLIYSLGQGNNLRKLWKSLPINKEERARNGLKERDV
jgi:hypothetical protein